MYLLDVFFLSIELVPDDEGFRSVAIRVSLDVKKDFLRQKLKLFFFTKGFKQPLQIPFKIQSLRNVRKFDKSVFFDKSNFSGYIMKV